MDRALIALAALVCAAPCLSPGGVSGASPESASPESLVIRSLADREVLILGNGSIGPYSLGEGLILPGSEEITRGDRVLGSVLDYMLDADSGIITLSQPLLQGQELRVRFQVAPFRLQKSYVHRRPLTASAGNAPTRGPTVSPALPAGMAPVGAGAPAGIPPATPPGSPPGAIVPRGTSVPGVGPGALAGLTIGGSKTITLGAGTGRDLAVDQELNLTISGRLTPDVEVKALLSDRNLPIQPEGTTRELDRLDQVRVEVLGPHAEVALGDYEIGLGGGSQFVPLSRELEGVRASYSAAGGSIAAGTAIARGKFHRKEFMGVEGQQGPYVLTDDAGTTEIVVLAGSETVWLDGVEMVRGEDNDYIVDYSRGRLEFTRKHLITSESRIAVDYQFSNEAFRRNLFFGSGDKSLLDGRLRFGSILFREGDDAEVTRGTPLTGSQRTLLEAAGDEEVFAPGWEFVGSGNGEYHIYPPAAPGEDSLLVYASKDTLNPLPGDYRARFTQVSGDSGTYVRKYDDITLRYYFEHSPGGDYVPRIRLIRPRSLTVADLKLELAPRPELLFSGEIAGSREDQNILSSLDDGNNDDTAIAFRGELRSLPLAVAGLGLGRMSLTARTRDVGPNFAAPGATLPAFYGAEWNLQGGRQDATGVSETDEEALREVRLDYVPGSALTLHGTAGRLRRGDDLRSRRWEGGADMPWPRGGKLSAVGSHVTTERGDTTSVARVAQIGFDRAIRRIYGQGNFVHDFRDDEAGGALQRGYGYRELGGLFGVGDRARTHVQTEAIVRRNREVRVGAWQDLSIAREGALSMAWSRDPGGLTARLARRSLRFDSGAEGTDTQTDLAEVVLRDLFWPRTLSSDLTYRITNTSEDTEERRFVRVGHGADYDSIGNYIPGEGEFAPVRVPTGSLPVTAVELSTRVRWSGRGRPMGGESFVSIEERSREDDRWKLYTLNPSILQKEGATLFGRIQLRQDFLFNEGNELLSARLRLGHLQERDFRVVNHTTTRREDEQELRLRGAPRPGLTVEGRLRRGREISSAQGSTVSGNEDLTSWELHVDSRYQLSRPLEAVVTSAASTHHDAVSGRYLRSAEAGPGASYSLGGRARVEGGILGRLSSGLEAGGLPVSGLGVIKRSGLEWRLSLDYRVSRLIQGTLRYTGSDLEARPIEHRGSAEFRAYF